MKSKFSIKKLFVSRKGRSFNDVGKDEVLEVGTSEVEGRRGEDDGINTDYCFRNGTDFDRCLDKENQSRATGQSYSANRDMIDQLSLNSQEPVELIKFKSLTDSGSDDRALKINNILDNVEEYIVGLDPKYTRQSRGTLVRQKTITHPNPRPHQYDYTLDLIDSFVNPPKSQESYYTLKNDTLKIQDEPDLDLESYTRKTRLQSRLKEKINAQSRFQEKVVASIYNSSDPTNREDSPRLSDSSNPAPFIQDAVYSDIQSTGLDDNKGYSPKIQKSIQGMSEVKIEDNYINSSSISHIFVKANDSRSSKDNTSLSNLVRLSISSTDFVESFVVKSERLAVLDDQVILKDEIDLLDANPINSPSINSQKSDYSSSVSTFSTSSVLSTTVSTAVSTKSSTNHLSIISTKPPIISHQPSKFLLDKQKRDDLDHIFSSHTNNRFDNQRAAPKEDILGPIYESLNSLNKDQINQQSLDTIYRALGTLKTKSKYDLKSKYRDDDDVYDDGTELSAGRTLIKKMSTNFSTGLKRLKSFAF